MPEPMVRGHVIAHTAEFFRTECDPGIALRVHSSIPLELRNALSDLSPAAWYPRQYQVDLLNAVALAHGELEAAQRDLLRCGTKIALADNQFMTLLTKLLTPELFLRKAERFWVRDHQNSGTCELGSLDVESGVAQLRLRNVGGYAHAAIVWMGFMKGILDKVVPNRPEISQRGWTWSAPDPDEIVYDVRWS